MCEIYSKLHASTISCSKKCATTFGGMRYLHISQCQVYCKFPAVIRHSGEITIQKVYVQHQKIEYINKTVLTHLSNASKYIVLQPLNVTGNFYVENIHSYHTFSFSAARQLCQQLAFKALYNVDRPSNILRDKACGARERNHSTEKVWYEFSIYVKCVILLFSLTSRGRDFIMYITGITCLSNT